MAYDRTTTSNKWIVIAGGFAVTMLFILHFVFDSYFITIVESTKHEKMASPEQLLQSRERERKALASLDSTMTQMARQGRAGATGAADITPKQSDDIAALSGWNKLPQKAEPFTQNHPADLTGSLSNNPTVDEADAGAEILVDAGQDAESTYTPQR